MKWTEEELRDCFYVFDSDGNGFIDMDELVTACKMLGCDDQQAEKLAQVNIKLPEETVPFNFLYSSVRLLRALCNTVHYNLSRNCRNFCEFELLQ